MLFRNYLELVANSVEDWVKEEEVKYQEEKMAREAGSLKLQKAMPEGPFELSTCAVKKTDFLKKAKSRYLCFILENSFYMLSTETQSCSEQNCMYFFIGLFVVCIDINMF